ncbi:Serine/threonine-protein kinase 4 [Balamuthia mandrillaris]
MDITEGDPEEIFDMLDKIGEGSYGIVCKCKRKSDGKLFAIKLIELEGEDDTAIRKEIDILKACDSDLVVRYGGCYKKGSTLLIAMEFCDGGSVQDLLRIAKLKMTEEQIACICGQILEGLVYLHSHHIMHRDIKSGNILLTQSGAAKLADFGVSARLQSTFQKRATVIGSPYWMAPEIIAKSNEGYDSRADIWSLGITAIEMADGVPPRYDIHFARVIFIIPQREPPTFKEEDKWSSEFRDFTSKCLQKDCTKRPTAKELLQHPFIKKGRGKNQLIASLVTQALPVIEEHRAMVAAKESAEDDDDSGTIVKRVSTVEIRGGEGSSDTLVTNDKAGPNHIKGLDLSNVQTYM